MYVQLWMVQRGGDYSGGLAMGKFGFVFETSSQTCRRCCESPRRLRLCFLRWKAQTAEAALPRNAAKPKAAVRARLLRLRLACLSSLLSLASRRDRLGCGEAGCLRLFRSLTLPSCRRSLSFSSSHRTLSRRETPRRDSPPTLRLC